MAILEILKFPDPRLKKVSLPVDKVTPELVQLADNMLETMYASHGIGLAAPQVGELIRLLVIDTRPRDVEGRYDIKDQGELESLVEQPIVIFNPQIIKSEGKVTFDEGCLSVPTFYETVERAQYVEVQGLGRDGKSYVIKTDGLLAICLQHEMDHLDGKLFIDRISFVKSNRIKNKIKKYGYPSRDEESDEELGEEVKL